MTDKLKVNLRSIALSLLTEYEESGKYVNLSLTSHKTDNLSADERSFLTALLYTTVEHKLTYDYYIGALSGRGLEKIDTVTRNIIRLGLCQLIDMQGVPAFAAINETVKLCRHSGERSFVNAVLREADRCRGELPLPKREKNASRYLSVKYSFPLWTVKRYISILGEEETEELLARFNSIPPTDITVNTCKVSKEALRARIEAQGYTVSNSPISPLSLRILGSVDPRRLSGYDAGEFFVQDSASASAVAALGAQGDETLIDVCACPGGKSFAAAIMMEDRGRVTSFDIHESKISLIESGAERLGLTSVKAMQNDAREPKAELLGTADRVICDVPCSGLGVLAKKPDLRYKSCESIKELPDLQYEILKASAQYLKSGGVIIYSTCTLLPEENEEVVVRFLAENKDFRAFDFKIGEYSSSHGMFTYYPTRTDTDGFFAAILKKE